MTTTAQRLATLSGLSGVSAAAHLIAIKQSGATAGSMLASRSGIGTGSAAQHLLDAGVAHNVAISLNDSASGSDGISRQGSLLYGAPVQRWFEEAQREREAARAAEVEALRHQESGSVDHSTGSDALGISVSVSLRDAAYGRDTIGSFARVRWHDKAGAKNSISTQLVRTDSQESPDDCAFGQSGISIGRRLARHVMDDDALMAIGVL